MYMLVTILKVICFVCGQLLLSCGRLLQREHGDAAK
jgi:hypothetical protein|tara:strand:- start:2194 stop:2301 length:108 start_codon:yes stop_codon:yes gene_type:complete